MSHRKRMPANSAFHASFCVSILNAVESSFYPRYKKLKDENKQACDLMLLYSKDLRLAHRMKEWLYDICQMKAYRQQQREFDDRIANALNCGIKEFEDCARTYRTWRKEILNAYKYRLTNGPTESFNNKIKVLKRSCCRIRNFKRFRPRILHCTS